MPRNDSEEEATREPRNWTEWRDEAHQALSELDRALAQARQVIYRLRPMVRPKNEQQTEDRPERPAQPTQFQRRRQARS